MTDEARVLARELFRQHERVCQGFTVASPDDVTDSMIKESVISYGRLCERAGVAFLTRGVGRFLGEVADWCYEKGWPPVNALAVNGEAGIPGEGYYDLSVWPAEVRNCISYRSYPASREI